MTSTLRLLTLAFTLAALVAAFALSAPAQAQGEPDYSYVDLLMVYEQGPSGNESRVSYSVQNIGTATATGVTVSFLLEDLQLGSFADNEAPPITTGKETVNTTDQRFTWEIGTIPAGGVSNTWTFATNLHSGRHSEVMPGWPGLIGVINATASSISPEPDILLTNNVIRIYSFAHGTVTTSEHMEGNRLALRLSVDDLQPAVEGNVNFDLTAQNLNAGEVAASDFINLIADASVKVELSKGLEFKDDWSPPSTFMKSGSQSATWSAPDTDTKGGNTRPNSQAIQIQAQLTSDTLTDIPLEKRCITAWITSSVPPPSVGYPLSSITECLGEDPPVLLEEGSVAFLTSFPCIADTHTDAHQCESVPGVAVAARLPSRHADYMESDNFYANLISHGVGRTDEYIRPRRTVFLDPESVVIQVKDPEGRVQDSHDHSVSAVSWQTARKAIAMKNRAVDGVVITYTRKDIKDASAWNSLGPRVLTVTRADGATPGKVKIRLNSSGNQFFDLSSGTQTKNAFNITSVSTSVTPYFAEFETLGTYLIDYSLTLTDSSSTAHQDSGTYTFHVGPVAELEVSDGGRSPRVVAGQRAYTIEAVNNGPDAAPAVQVSLSGLDADSCAGSATKGSVAFTGGECVWTIGELETKEFHQAVYGRDGETLTIITSAAVGSTITAAISNTQDYEVCIDDEGNDVDAASESACTGTTGNTWHSTNYYDYISDNDSANIKAEYGTGADLPALQMVEASTAAIIVTWDPVTEVNGRGVTHYEVQRQDNPWTTIARVLEPRYADASIGAGATSRYRVRAVNDRGHPGPWSVPGIGRTTGAEVAPGAPTGVSARAEGGSAIVVSWGPPADDGGLAVTSYQVRWSANGASGWRNFSAQDADARNYTHSGLAFGATRYYQVRARNSAGWGSWSATVSAATATGVPAAPNLTARATGASTVALSWTEPADNASAIIRYEIERAPDVAGSAGTFTSLTSTGATVRTHDDTGLEPGGTYHYRVRAVNGAGDGSWSAVRSATTTAVTPGVPQNLRAAADGENAINLSWDEPGDTGGSAITQYRVELRAMTASGLGGASNRTVSANSLEYAHTGLTVGSTWQYRVQARNGAGWGEWSDPVQATTQTGVPAAPGNFRATANGSSEIVLSWSEPDGRGEHVQFYHIEWSADGSAGWAKLASVDSATTVYMDVGLEAGTTRYYRVRARNFNGMGAWSATRSATTAANAPGAPTGLMVTERLENSISLSWTPPAGASTVITGYRVERSRHGEAPWERVATLGAVTTYTDSRDLYPGMTRHYRVAAVNSGGAGPWSNVAEAMTTGEPAAAPGWVDNLRISSTGSNWVSLAWNPSPDDGGAPVTGYRYHVTSPSGAWAPSDLGPNARSVRISGLNEEGGYVFAVWAVNAVGDGLAEWVVWDPPG